MKNNLNKKEKIFVVIGIIGIIAIITASIIFHSLFFGSLDGFNTWISLLSIIGLIATIAIAIAEFKKSKEISRASFIVELNQTFIENEQYKKLYDELQDCFDNKCQHISNGNVCPNECMLNIDKSIISNYLTFFETLYLLIQREVVTYEIIDDLFAYRFFLVVHSKLVQQKKIIPQPENFINIFRLEHDWIEYRISVKKITRSHFDAAKEKYYTILHGTGNAIDVNEWRDVYCMRPLEAIVDSEKYSKWINIRS